MMITPRVLLVAFLATHVAVAPVIAQTTVQATDATSVSALSKRLKPGTRMEITTADAVVTGRFNNRTNTAFIIDVPEADGRLPSTRVISTVVPFDTVRSLTYDGKLKMSGGKKAAIGIAVGAGIFFGLGGLAMFCYSGNSC